MKANNTPISLKQTVDVARELFQKYAISRLPQITSRRFGQADMLRWLRPIQETGLFTMAPVGTSAEGRTISLLTLGGGEVTVLLWSQMHGDEPTATMALMDILNFLSTERQHPVSTLILQRLKLLIVPMLNPDGAERFQRRTAQAIDMNRDALALETPEARILKETRDRYRPRFGFNFHDQDPRYTVGRSKEVSTIALLAPAFDDSGTDNEVRLAAKKVATVFALVMNEFIPGHISKYDDSFEPRAFGDSIQKWGTSTVLVESGGWAGDPDKMYIRQLNYVGILASLYSIASGSYIDAPIDVYGKLPFSTKYLYDIILRRCRLAASAHAAPVTVDVGINVDETANAVTGRVEPIGTIVDIGDLHLYGAFRDVPMNGRMLPNDKIRMDVRLSFGEIESLITNK